MPLDNRTPAEREYDRTRLSRPLDIAADPWIPIVEQCLDSITGTFNPNTYDYDKCISVVTALEAAIGLPPNAESVSGRMFDQETCDALDLFCGWWQKARQDRQHA